MRLNRSQSATFVKRKYKRKTTRKLSASDIQVLDFLWTWKVASTQILKIVAFKGKSDWWVYKAIRQLISEKYIMPLPRGKYLNQEVLTLTELGFEVVLMDRDDIQQYRFKPHAPAHDYFATCLQLGDLWLSDCQKVFFTEQMLASLRSNNFPSNYASGEGHLPDGITRLQNGLKSVAVGYEVDLNLKEEDRYIETIRYYENIEDISIVIWLVRNDWIAERISKVIAADGSRYKPKQFSFIRLDDFKNQVWDAKVFRGANVGLSVRKIHTNLMQSLGKTDANIVQNNLKDIFFSDYKSPQKSSSYGKTENTKID
tara:strand:- start:277264 stop:278202 length:939 start_codon:yes stop_codon:yes gene_type:complete